MDSEEDNFEKSISEIKNLNHKIKEIEANYEKPDRKKSMSECSSQTAPLWKAKIKSFSSRENLHLRRVQILKFHFKMKLKVVYRFL